MPSLGTINEAPRLVELPPKPEWFDDALADIERLNGVPLFKCVDGQRELMWRNGEMQIKHFLQTDDQACFARIERQYYLRKNAKTGEYHEYLTAAQAAADKTLHLFLLIEPRISVEVRMVGKPCWIIETYIPPEDIPRKVWDELRWQKYTKDGKEQFFDVFGEYPSEGKYIHCLDIVGDDGEAIEPNRRVIDSLKQRLWEYQKDTRALEQRIKDDMERERLFNEKQAAQMVDNFYQARGIAAYSQFHNVAVSKPVMIDLSLGAPLSNNN